MADYNNYLQFVCLVVERIALKTNVDSAKKYHKNHLYDVDLSYVCEYQSPLSQRGPPLINFKEKKAERRICVN